MTTVNVDFETLNKFAVDAFMKIGVPAEDAAICADVVLESDRRGIESHGINRLKPFYVDRVIEGIQNPVTNFEIIRETPTTAVVDGHNGMGQVIGVRAMRLAVDKTKKYGMGMVVAKNSCHYGIAGYYTSIAADAGLIGLTGTNARPSIAPTFGVQNMLGTNPFTVGFPTDEPFNFSFDSATSITQRGKIEHYARIGKKIPAGTVIGSDGSALTDPANILKKLSSGEAALAPLGGIGEEMGGHKGYGLAVVVEVLSAALAQGNFLTGISGIGADGKKTPYRLGHYFIAIYPKRLWGWKTLKRPPAILCGSLGLLKKRLCTRTYTRRGKRNTKFRSSVKSAVCQ